MGFLGVLSDQIGAQFSIGENNNTDPTSVISGQNISYATLGDVTNNLDQTDGRKYVESGYIRQDPYTTNPDAFQVLLQEPDATILVKKRMFSSVAENFRPDYMDQDETLYYRATKVLFQNKCR